MSWPSIFNRLGEGTDLFEGISRRTWRGRTSSCDRPNTCGLIVAAAVVVHARWAWSWAVRSSSPSWPGSSAPSCPASTSDGPRGRRLKKFDDQLGDMLNLVVNGLRAGYSTLQAHGSGQPRAAGPDLRRVPPRGAGDAAGPRRWKSPRSPAAPHQAAMTWTCGHGHQRPARSRRQPGRDPGRDLLHHPRARAHQGRDQLADGSGAGHRLGHFDAAHGPVAVPVPGQPGVHHAVLQPGDPVLRGPDAGPGGDHDRLPVSTSRRRSSPSTSSGDGGRERTELCWRTIGVLLVVAVVVAVDLGRRRHAGAGSARTRFRRGWPSSASARSRSRWRRSSSPRASTTASSSLSSTRIGKFARSVHAAGDPAERRGGSWRWPATRCSMDPAFFLTLRFVLAVVFGGLLFVVFLVTGRNWVQGLALTVVFLLIGFIFPDLWLTSTDQPPAESRLPGHAGRPRPADHLRRGRAGLRCGHVQGA